MSVLSSAYTQIIPFLDFIHNALDFFVIPNANWFYLFPRIAGRILLLSLNSKQRVKTIKRNTIGYRTNYYAYVLV